MKTSTKRENNECLVITLKHVNRLGTPKLWAIAHENGHKTCKWRVFGHALKHVSGLMVILNRPGTPILWAITHENGHNTQTEEFLVITLKPVNRLGTPKLWAVAHENGHKTRKRRVFGQNSQTCIGSYGPCESP